MTKQQCKKLVNSLKKDVNKQISDLTDRALNSGALDISSADSRDFDYAKVILTVALETISKKYQPYFAKNRKEMENLRNFI